MKVFAAFCMLAVGVTAGGVYVSPHDIQAFLQRVERVEEFQAEVTARLENSTDRALTIYDALDDVRFGDLIEKYYFKEDDQNRRLLVIYDRIRADSLALAQQRARLAGARAQAALNEAQAYRIAKRLAELLSLNVKEDADLAEIAATISESLATVQNSINVHANQSQEEIDQLASVQASADYVNSQVCFVGEKELNFEYKKVAEGTIYIPEDFFTMVPQVYCSIRGFETKLNLQRTEGYNPYSNNNFYRSYDSSVRKERNYFNFRLECEFVDGRIRVHGFDASEGGDELETLYVVAKACSTPPQAN